MSTFRQRSHSLIGKTSTSSNQDVVAVVGSNPPWGRNGTLPKIANFFFIN